ncbi:hypothetical protein [Metamycoplasma equirhinis]
MTVAIIGTLLIISLVVVIGSIHLLKKKTDRREFETKKFAFASKITRIN